MKHFTKSACYSADFNAPATLELRCNDPSVKLHI